MKKIFDVTFSYTLSAEAETKEEAEALAKADFDDIMPRTDEMNIEVTEAK